MIKRLLIVLLIATAAHGAEPPADFPRFIVPGHEPEMDSLRRMFWLHYEPARPLATLWDEWLPQATLWPAVSNEKVREMRQRWAKSFAARGINDEGYVHTHQHDGPAHAEGWPFPGWHIAGGIGWHFRGTGIEGYDLPTVEPEGWLVTGGNGRAVDDRGWVIELAEPKATALTPKFSIEAKTSPWLRLNWWASGLDSAECYVEWTTKEKKEFGPDRRVKFSPAKSLEGGETRTMIPLYRTKSWAGTITRLRVGFENAAAAKVIIKSFHTSPDTRHNINNTNFIRGCHDYFMWTRDEAFLREQMPRIRKAMRFVQREFDTIKRKCIYTTWPGHEGRSGVRYRDGVKQVIPGEGIGSNYWDLLPFGGEDALATIYYYDALLDLAELEEHLSAPSDAFDPAELRRHARAVRSYGQQRFWNAATGRFGTRDLDGRLYDFGWTFLNNEAVYYDFASARQAKQIRDWISGRRTIPGDSSFAADIYKWRFGPRSSTLRNIDYYFWGWSNPETIPFGAQVQDGGAVLGFSYHDLMSILKVEGPDAARLRLREITKWFDDTQKDGGYRAYYDKDKSRGTMQGGNVPGGLGIDKEFFESVLVPQVMLYGFLGFKPTPEGFSVNPKLPKDWRELTITRIALGEHVLDIKATRENEMEITTTGPTDRPMTISVPRRLKISATPPLSVKVEHTPE